MELCAFCKVEDTALYEGGVPICLTCVALREAKSQNNPPPSVHNDLVLDVKTATLRAEAATMEFNKVTSDIPSFLPPPDGTQRIQNASRKMAEARKALMTAHRRLNDYLERGIVPEDLKRGG